MRKFIKWILLVWETLWIRYIIIKSKMRLCFHSTFLTWSIYSAFLIILLIRRKILFLYWSRYSFLILSLTFFILTIYAFIIITIFKNLYISWFCKLPTIIIDCGEWFLFILFRRNELAKKFCDFIRNPIRNTTLFLFIVIYLIFWQFYSFVMTCRFEMIILRGVGGGIHLFF